MPKPSIYIYDHSYIICRTPIDEADHYNNSFGHPSGNRVTIKNLDTATNKIARTDRKSGALSTAKHAARATSRAYLSDPTVSAAF